ncbi:MAG: PAS domain S-box protein [Prolixibacteraceae bacterium]|nr:PAS domain S-box protein [Prolixibacteraceae bacterium]
MDNDCSGKNHFPQNLELFYEMVENARDGINITQNGIFRYVNKAFCDMIGYKREELCCMTASDLLPEREKERMIKQHFDRMQGTGRFGLDQTTLLHKNGTEIEIEFNASAINYEGELASFISIRDITERKRMQEKLEQSEQKYRNLVENAHDGIIITQFGKFKFVNKAFCNMIEYSEEELVEHNFIDLVVDEDKERLLEYHRKRMAGEKHNLIYEAKAIAKSGRIIHFEINTSYIDFNGNPATFIILRDHTAQKELEQTLIANEKKYRRLFEAESDAIFLIDKESGRIMDANPAASKIYGYSHDEFLKLTNIDISAEPEKTKEATVRDLSFVPIRYHRKKDGSRIAVEISAGITELDNRAVHIITARDISERIRMQNELRESELKYRTLIEKSLDGIVISQDGEVVLVNKAFADMMGYTVDECMTSFGPDSIAPEDRDRVLGIHYRRMRGELSDMRYNATMIRKNGDRVIAEFNSTTIEINGRPASLITTRDITSRLQMQEALEKSERKFRDLSNLLPQTVYELDSQGFVTYMNAAGRKAFGLDDDEIGFHAFGGIIPEDRERMQNNIQRAYSEKRTNDVEEYTALRKDGNTFPAIFYSAAMVENGVHTGTRGLIIDISERKAMEEALRKSEQKFRELADLLPQIIYELDAEGYVTYVNKTGRETFGFETDVARVHSSEFFIPEDKMRMVGNIRKALSGQKTSLFNEYTAIRSDRTEFPVMIYAAPMTDNGKHIGLRGLIVDISERKAMEEALRKSEQKFRELADLLPQTIFELDLGGNVTYLNKAGRIAFGTREDEIGFPATTGVIPEDHDRLKENIQKAFFEKGREGGMEYTALRRDGVTFPIVIYSSPMTENDQIKGIRGLIVDISERKAMEEALRKSEEHYRQVIQSLQEGLFVLQDEKFRFVNDAIVDILGYTVEEMTGKHFSAVIPPELRDEAVRRNMRRRKGDGDSWSYEFLLLHKDQQTRIPVILSTNLTELDGKTAVVGTAKDITDRIRAEEEIKAAHKRLEEINRDLEQTIRERTKELTKANTQLLKLQKENLQSQFDVLKQQVNPHFLFNSLNVLTSLIRVEPELAEKFTEHLAKVYRYVLENKDNELVTLSTEMSFLDAYIFLINIRFMDKVQVNIRIPDDRRNHRIIPLAMQLLIENAIKHNSMSKKSPLVIDIFIDGQNLLNVVNNLQEREAHMVSTGVGLKNIQNRYKLLNNTSPSFEKTDTHFVARIPLVTEFQN